MNLTTSSDVKLTLSSRPPQTKPASGLNCHPEMYISWGNNIFVRKLTFVQFTRLIEQPTAGAHDRCRIASKAVRWAKTRVFTISRAREYHKTDSSLSVRGPRMVCPGSTTCRDSAMTNFKLLSLAAILSTAIVTPVFAQQAVDEPGMQAFYQSLGVGSHDSPTASAMASARGSYASAPAKHISAKHYARAHK